MQAKVSQSKDLEEQLAQAIELAHSRDARHEEMMKKIELLMGQQTFEPAGWTARPDPYQAYNEQAMHTPPRITLTTESPPQKKANTNNSPQRHFYTLFRPPSGKTSRHHQQKLNHGTLSERRNAKLLTQPMETEDEQLKPPPEVKSGKKIE